VGVKEDMGNALGIAQFGGTAPTAKPWKGLGPGVLRSSSRTTATRIERCIRFGSRRQCTSSMRSRRSLRPASGRPKRDVDLVAERLKTAERDHEEHYGKSKR
jgi:hypothetical protein